MPHITIYSIDKKLTEIAGCGFYEGSQPILRARQLTAEEKPNRQWDGFPFAFLFPVRDESEGRTLLLALSLLSPEVREEIKKSARKHFLSLNPEIVVVRQFKLAGPLPEISSDGTMRIAAGDALPGGRKALRHVGDAYGGEAPAVEATNGSVVEERAVREWLRILMFTVINAAKA